MEHSRAHFVRLLTLIGIGSVLTLGRSGESNLADNATVEKPKGRTSTKRESAYLGRLEQLAASGGHGVNLAEMTDDEIRARLLGR